MVDGSAFFEKQWGDLMRNGKQEINVDLLKWRSDGIQKEFLILLFFIEYFEEAGSWDFYGGTICMCDDWVFHFGMTQNILIPKYVH